MLVSVNGVEIIRSWYTEWKFGCAQVWAFCEYLVGN